MSTHRIIQIVFLFAILLVVGCSGKTNEPKSSGSTPSTSTEETSPRPPRAVTEVSASPAPDQRPIAEADGETPGTKVQVQELKRSSNSLMLKFAIVNNSEKPVSFGYNFGDKSNEIKDFSSVGGVTLVDSVGKKKYFVVRDTENTCVCSTDLKDIKPGSRANLWAKFPAPPDDVQKISVVIPHFGPLDDVPISK